METREERINNFWSSSPSEYAKNQTKDLEENIQYVAYPAAYLFRSLFTVNFWMFALVGIIIFVSAQSIITNEIE